MGNRKPLTDDDGEVRELPDADFAQAKSFSELPAEHQRVLKGILAEREKRERVSIPLSPEVLKKMQATGEGWELRIEDAVRQWLARQGKRRRIAS